MTEDVKPKVQVLPAANRTQLATELQKAFNQITQKDSELFVEYLFKLINKSLPYVQKIAIAEFGTFSIKLKQARKRAIPSRNGGLQGIREMGETVRVHFKPDRKFNENLENAIETVKKTFEKLKKEKEEKLQRRQEKKKVSEKRQVKKK